MKLLISIAMVFAMLVIGQRSEAQQYYQCVNGVCTPVQRQFQPVRTTARAVAAVADVFTPNLVMTAAVCNCQCNCADCTCGQVAVAAPPVYQQWQPVTTYGSKGVNGVRTVYGGSAGVKSTAAYMVAPQITYSRPVLVEQETVVQSAPVISESIVTYGDEVIYDAPMDDCTMQAVAVAAQRLGIRARFAERRAARLERRLGRVKAVASGAVRGFRRFFGRRFAAVQSYQPVQTMNSDCGANLAYQHSVAQARVGAMQSFHPNLNNWSDGARSEGTGFSTRSAEDALLWCCDYGTKPLHSQSVVRGPGGWYATARYR